MEFSRERIEQSFDHFYNISDSRTVDLYLMRNAHPLIFQIIVAYLAFVCMGPKWMKSREAFGLRMVMIWYNAIVILLSAVVFVGLTVSFFMIEYNTVMCSPYRPERNTDYWEIWMARLTWLYFFSKLIELGDTVIMILRKKDQQISFLHVWHHGAMFIWCWFVTLYSPGAHMWLSGSINSFVHVVMYSYYLLNLFPEARKYLWWKKWITQLQISSFVIMLSHLVIAMGGRCDYPDILLKLLTALISTFLVLFINFYVKAYNQTKARSADLCNNNRNNVKAD